MTAAVTGWPVLKPQQLTCVEQDQRWLVDSLWPEQGVGIVGGEPKVGKTLFVLDLAIAVATGTPCLGRFPVSRTGPVLLFAAEDAQHILHQRLVGISAAAGADFNSLDIHVIDVPTMRLDRPDHASCLAATVARIQPRLLILDPLVRLHSADENAAGEMAALLSSLRALQRNHETAVLVVHHARKSGAARAGQALRGSGELHAWADTTVFLKKKNARIVLSAEHRAAPEIDALDLELRDEPPVLALRVRGQPPPPAQPTPRDRILHWLQDHRKPVSHRHLRAAVGMRDSTVTDILSALTDEGLIRRTTAGIVLATPDNTPENTPENTGDNTPGNTDDNTGADTADFWPESR